MFKNPMKLPLIESSSELIFGRIPRSLVSQSESITAAVLFLNSQSHVMINISPESIVKMLISGDIVNVIIPNIKETFQVVENTKFHYITVYPSLPDRRLDCSKIRFNLHGLESYHSPLEALINFPFLQEYRYYLTVDKYGELVIYRDPVLF
jgi:hypothetical protein